MDKDKLTKKLLGGFLIGGLLMGGGGLALASNYGDSASRHPSGDAHFSGYQGAGQGKMTSEISPAVLDSLLSTGTLTQDQAEKIKAAIEKRAAERQTQLEAIQKLTPEERQAERVKIQNMTAEERRAYKQAHKPVPGNFLNDLVTDGTLSQAQADQVKQAISNMHGGSAKQHGPGSGKGGMRGPGPHTATTS